MEKKRNKEINWETEIRKKDGDKAARELVGGSIFADRAYTKSLGTLYGARISSDMEQAYQNAESSWLAPLDYSYLLFACVWGKLIFDVWPSNLNLIGITLIAFAGILIAYREKLKN